MVHVNVGDCVTVNFTNKRSSRPSQPQRRRARQVRWVIGHQRRLRPGADGAARQVAGVQVLRRDESIEAAQFTDFGGDATGRIGLYGAFVVHEKDAWFTSPTTGARTMSGAIVDAHVPGKPGYRDVTLLLQDADAQIGADFMPYPLKVDGLTLINYKNAGRRTDDFTGTWQRPCCRRTWVTR